MSLCNAQITAMTILAHVLAVALALARCRRWVAVLALATLVPSLIAWAAMVIP